MHQVEGLVDLRQRHGVRDQVVDVDASLHVPVDDFGHVAPAFGAAECGAFPNAAGHQLEGPRGNFLACRRHADYHAGTPSALAAFQRLAHQLDVADAFEGVIRAAAGQIDDEWNEVALHFGGIDEMRHAELLSNRLARGIEIDPDDHTRARQPRPLYHVKADTAQTEHHDAVAGLDSGGIDYGADSRSHTASDVTNFVEGSVLAHLGQRDFRHHREIGEGGGAHIVMHHSAVHGKTAGPVRHHAAPLGFANRGAQ